MTILDKLFTRSPFFALQNHMEKVSLCVQKLDELFQSNVKKDYPRIQQLCDEISELEHEADITKNEIRNHLPKGLFLPVHRGDLLEILALQDTIADRVEDIGVLISLKKLKPLKNIQPELQEMLSKNVEVFNKAYAIIQEMDNLLETSFGGREAEKVREMIERVAFLEHEADLLQRNLMRKLYRMDDQLSVGDFMLWINIFQKLASIADVCEKMANRIRMMLDVK